MSKKQSASSLISELKRKTRKKYSAEEKIRIILEGMRGEISVAELCRREGIYQANYYKWSKDFMEAGKKRLNGDTLREANSSEVGELKEENSSLKELVAELSLENKRLKKNDYGVE
ncbi:MAG: transposase [Flavobacteriales bacterium]|nr:transposase [Flavobacteriales bacterium]